MTIAARLALALLLLLTGVVPARAAEERAPVTILISIDGCRPDYLDRGVTPNLTALAAAGVRGTMRPSFPSVTFPNHFTLVTGLRPDRNGMVGNKMSDAARPGVLFKMATEDDFWWSEAEPVWAAAERAGIATASLFWPGTNSGHKGLRPHDWFLFDTPNSERQRVDAVIDWLRRPAATRPRFVMLYFDKVDHEGHKHGISSPELTRALADTDAAIGRLRDGLAALGQPANIVVVSDHGMATVAPDHAILLATLVDPAKVDAVETGPYAALNPLPGQETAVAAALARPHGHVRCWPKDKIPARLAYGRNPRVPAWICLADVGWKVVAKTDEDPDPGAHGYDNAAPEMRAIFVAAGPAFRSGRTLPPFDNVDVEPLLRDLIGLPPGADRDGDDRVFRPVLTATAPRG